MTPLVQLAARSAWHRRGTLALVMLSIALAAFLLLTLERLRQDLRSGFAQAVSGTDLVVGARTGPVQLMLYAVFRIGGATNNVSTASLQDVERHRAVAWVVPLSLGDSHRGFPVMGTTPAYFERFRYGDRQPLVLVQGRPHAGTLDGLYEAVIGAEVAERLGYGLGQRITLTHGLPSAGAGALAAEHADKPFTVVGVLARTGTPVDRTVHVGLEAITAIHVDWQSGVHAPPGARIGAEEARQRDLTPDSITAFMIGMRTKVLTFTMQRAINEYRQEPLMAILPGVALTQLWDLVGIADTALMIVAAFVVLAGLLGMLTAILTSLNERRREMAILRSVGAQPRHVFTLLVAEAGTLATCGVLAGVALTYVTLALARPLLERRFGIFLEVGGLTRYDLGLLGAIIGAAFLMGALPAWRAYRNTLSDGLTIRV